MWNCVQGHALKRSTWINCKSRVFNPGPGFLSSAKWPFELKKHYNGLIIIIILWHLIVLMTPLLLQCWNVISLHCILYIPKSRLGLSYPRLWWMKTLGREDMYIDTMAVCLCAIICVATHWKQQLPNSISLVWPEKSFTYPLKQETNGLKQGDAWTNTFCLNTK